MGLVIDHRNDNGSHDKPSSMEGRAGGSALPAVGTSVFEKWNKRFHALSLFFRLFAVNDYRNYDMLFCFAEGSKLSGNADMGILCSHFFEYV